MNAARFQRVKEVYLRVAGLDAGPREQALATECRGDDALAAEVRSLLAADTDQGFLAEPALGGAFSVAEAIARADGLAVGPYRTLAVLGAGTFGIVYRASQADGPDVALKVLRPGRATPDLTARFLREGATLGQLAHPGIARVLATGVTAMFGDEVPWLAMELVAGQPLDRHVQIVGADARRRVALVADLAAAVAHAHALGVVHNDLKPENVLVTDAGEVKVIDFGLAAFVGEGEAGGGTLAYASPERWGQRAGGGVAADVWALGAIAYELLTDRLPLDWRRGSAEAPEPWPLGALRPELRGDLATIVHHALATDPRRRCPSASFFADELRRYLAGKPIRSPRPGPIARLAVLARQHRTAAIGVSTTFVALVLGIVGTATAWADVRSAWAAEQVQRAKAESSLAEVTAARERAVRANSMLTGLLRAPLQESDQGRSDLQAVYVAATRNLTVEAAFAAGLQPTIFVALADSLRHLGHYAIASRQMEKAVVAAERAGAGNLDLFELRLELGGLLLSADELVAAENAVQQARAHLDAMPEATNTQRIRCIHVEAQVAAELGNLQAMRRLIAEASEILSDRPESDADRLRVTRLIADAHRLAGEVDASFRVMEQGLAVAQRALGPDHALTLRMTNELATQLARAEQHERADSCYQTVLQASLRTLAADHPSVLQLQHNIGSLRVRQHRYDEAIAILEPTLAARARRLGKAHVNTILSCNSLAMAYALRGDLFAAEVLLRQALRDVRQSLPREGFLERTEILADRLADVLHMQGRDEEARSYASVLPVFEASRNGVEHASFRRASQKLERLRPL